VGAVGGTGFEPVVAIDALAYLGGERHGGQEALAAARRSAMGMPVIAA
jgi:hypothetical protein